MECIYKKELNEANFCKRACYYCTLDQEMRCTTKKLPPENKTMSRDEMIQFIKANPIVKITHTLFDEFEYIYSAQDGNVYDENGYLFEDWYSFGCSRRDGIRERVGGRWETGWSIKK